MNVCHVIPLMSATLSERRWVLRAQAVMTELHRSPAGRVPAGLRRPRREDTDLGPDHRCTAHVTSSREHFVSPPPSVYDDHR